MSDAARAFTEVTAQSIGPKYIEWLRELEEEFGDGRVEAAIRAEATTGPLNKLLYRVRDRLANERNRAAKREQPLRHLTAAEVMAVVRGEGRVPSAFTYETAPLTPEEYGQLGEWALKR